jgi:hypothetical protein
VTSYDPIYSSYYDPYSFVNYSPAYQDYYDPYDVNYFDPYSGYGDSYSYYDNSNDYGYGSDYCSLAHSGYWYRGSLADTLSRFLAAGYEEGYSDGIYARSYNNREDYFYNPYSYTDTSYDSYSYNLAQNRQCLSEGYELGYQDAISGRNGNGYSPLSYGNGDLVSLLLGNVLQTVN